MPKKVSKRFYWACEAHSTRKTHSLTKKVPVDELGGRFRRNKGEDETMKCPKCNHEAERCVKFSPKQSKSMKSLYIFCPNCDAITTYAQKEKLKQ